MNPAFHGTVDIVRVSIVRGVPRAWEARYKENKPRTPPFQSSEVETRMQPG